MRHGRREREKKINGFQKDEYAKKVTPWYTMVKVWFSVCKYARSTETQNIAWTTRDSCELDCRQNGSKRWQRCKAHEMRHDLLSLHAQAQMTTKPTKKKKCSLPDFIFESISLSNGLLEIPAIFL